MFSSQDQVPADCLGHNEMYAALRFLSSGCRHQQRLTNWSGHLKAAAMPPRPDTLIKTGKVVWRGVIGCGPDPCNFERQSMSEAGQERRREWRRLMTGAPLCAEEARSADRDSMASAHCIKKGGLASRRLCRSRLRITAFREAICPKIGYVPCCLGRPHVATSL